MELIDASPSVHINMNAGDRPLVVGNESVMNCSHNNSIFFTIFKYCLNTVNHPITWSVIWKLYENRAIRNSDLTIQTWLIRSVFYRNRLPRYKKLELVHHYHYHIIRIKL